MINHGPPSRDRIWREDTPKASLREAPVVSSSELWRMSVTENANATFNLKNDGRVFVKGSHRLVFVDCTRRLPYYSISLNLPLLGYSYYYC